VLNWFVRLAMDDETIPIFGDGKILRDFLYIDDLVSALMQCGLCEAAYGEIFNIGSSEAISFLALIRQYRRPGPAAGVPPFTERKRWNPATLERHRQDSGDRRVKPTVPLDGLTGLWTPPSSRHYWTHRVAWEGGDARSQWQTNAVT
jgi:nucleoside-diphosphate-sugar epimerase